MKTSAFIINIRTVINSRKIRYYISRFLNNDLFKSRYIQVQVEVISENNNNIKIGNEFLLDLKNQLEIKSFIFLIEQNYFSYNIEDKINKIVFKFKDLKKKDYLDLKIK